MTLSDSGEDLEDVGLAIIVLRSLPDPRWTQAELSRQSGVEKGQISDYEQGKTRPSRETRGRLSAAVGVDASFLDQLIPLCRGIRLTFERAVRQGRTGAPAESGIAPPLEEKITRAVLESMAPFLLQLARRDRKPVPSTADRAWAEARWSRLKPLPAEDQRLAVEMLRGDERSWALAERLRRASRAAGRASEALRLARLADRLCRPSPPPNL
jgi:transcriptional regulator with XRE-family HTH domain